MTRHPGQLENTYTAKQLEIIKCCSESNARRRYFPEQGGCLKSDDLIAFTVKNKKTRLIHFDLLTDQDQHKVAMYEAVNCKELEAARIKYLDELLTIPNQPAVANLPAVTSNLPAVATPKHLTIPDSTELTGKQDRIATARYCLMKVIEKRPKHIKVTPFIRELEKKLQSGKDEKLTSFANTANDRKGDREGVSFPTLMRWWTKHLACGKQVTAMAPLIKTGLQRTTIIDWLDIYQPRTAAVAVLPVEIPAWLPYFLDEYRRPQKPSLHNSLKNICRAMPPDIERPSYDQVRRIMKKIPDIYAEKGRMTGAEYNSILGYVDRDASGFAPMSICQIDGHSLKAYVAHPATGAHFHPEICGVICLTTKVLVGWNAGLAESHLTVAGAVKHACLISSKKPFGGIMSILEPDLGAGNKAKLNSDDFTGLFVRLGITVKFPERAGNPQGHGVIERSNQSIWITAAKNLPTYTGKDMDRGARRKVYDRLESDLKKIENEGKLGMVAKTSELLMSWIEFLEFLDQAAADYNNSPHKSLPKIIAPQPYNSNGPAVSRHMTPLECWADYVAQGFEPKAIGIDDELYLDKLCQPHVVKNVKRERFTLFGNQYQSAALDQYNNEQVIVAYDIHNPHRVTVLDLNEQYICDAQWNGNRVHARPVSAVENATMKRHTTRVKNAQRHIDLMNAEADNKTIEVRPLHIELPAETIEYEVREEQKKITRLNAPKSFADEHEVYDDIRHREKEGLAYNYELQWADDKDASLLSNRREQIGLYKSDQYCQGRFLPENMQIPMKKAAGA